MKFNGVLHMYGCTRLYYKYLKYIFCNFPVLKCKRNLRRFKRGVWHLKVHLKFNRNKSNCNPSLFYNVKILKYQEQNLNL